MDQLKIQISGIYRNNEVKSLLKLNPQYCNKNIHRQEVT